jgi:small-conductance mechanosensitive channel
MPRRGMMPSWVASLIIALAVTAGVSVLHAIAFRYFKARRGVTISRLLIVTLFVRLLIDVISDPNLLGDQHSLTGPATTSAVNGLLTLWILTLILRLIEPFLIPKLIPADKRGQVPKIFRDIVRVLLIAVVIMFVLKTGFGVELGALLTTSAILSAIVGFALQDTLGNILAGLAIYVEKPFEVGDWISVGDQEGMVDQMSWRTTRIWTRDNDYVVLPNSVISGGQIVNYNIPERLHREHFRVGVSYAAPPNKVKNVLLRVIKDSVRYGIVMDPAPEVVLISYDDFSVEYDLRFWIRDYRKKETIQDAVRSRVWYHFRRYGIEIPFPIRNVFLRPVSRKAEQEREKRELRELEHALERVPILEPLDEADVARLMEMAEVQHFAAGEDLVRQDETGDCFFIILRGNVAVIIRDEMGQEHEVSSLGKYDYFGEMSLLTGEKRNATVRSIEDCSVAVVDRGAFKHVIEANEAILESLTDIVHERLEQNRLKLEAGGKRHDELPPKRDKGWVRSTMQNLLGVGLFRGLTRKGASANVRENGDHTV